MTTPSWSEERGRKPLVVDDTWRAEPSATVMIVEGGSEGLRYSFGYAVTPRGIVGIYQQEGHYRLTFARRGRVYSRTVDADTSKRGLAGAATKFVNSLLGSSSRPSGENE